MAIPFVAVLCILLMIPNCFAQSATMVKNDFSEQGFSIVLPDDPSYESELRTLGFSSSPSPYSVVVKNTSQRGIVAFGMRFTKRFANGHIATSDVTETQPSALVDRARPVRHDKLDQVLVMPGSSRLVTPENGIVDSSPKATTSSTSYRPHLSWTIIKVELDSAIFDDGEAIGPDQLDVVKRLKAHIDAQQDLFEEISGRLATGEFLHAVLQDLTASSKTGFSEREVRAMTPTNLDQVYPLVRQHYLEELSATEANAGEEIAMRRLRQLGYTIRPQIRLQGEN